MSLQDSSNTGASSEYMTPDEGLSLPGARPSLIKKKTVSPRRSSRVKKRTEFLTYDTNFEPVIKKFDTVLPRVPQKPP